jgi:molybdate-binding protein/DNA-binding XRE family transcriptional regulator
MPNQQVHLNRVKQHRLAKGMSQVELAQAAGISRAGLSAIEVQRLVPSVSTALSLAAALSTSVEALFDDSPPATEPVWAAEPAEPPCRFWAADVAGRTVLFPVESASGLAQRQDGVWKLRNAALPAADVMRRTLVVATCDPAAGHLALEYGRQTPFRIIVLRRSSRAALDLVQRGLVHVAGIHFAEADSRHTNQQVLEQEQSSLALQLLPVARWEEGVAHASGLKLRSARQAANPRLRWIGRHEGAGARRCQDEVLGNRRPPQHVAADHADVVASIRSGFADAGICVRLAAAESQLNFLSICEEDYDLCFPQSSADDPRVAALIEVVRSASFRETIAELPGYRLRRAEPRRVTAGTHT